jgi:hypothetical protein
LVRIFVEGNYGKVNDVKLTSDNLGPLRYKVAFGHEASINDSDDVAKREREEMNL